MTRKAKHSERPEGERRNGQRKKLDVVIDFHTESQFYSGYSEDLSDGGVFVATYQKLDPGAVVHLELELPSGAHISASGRVVWVRDFTDSAPSGVGIAFEALAQDDRAAILDFVRERPPLFYDVGT